MKKSSLKWEEGARSGVPMASNADRVIATDYNRFGFGGDAWRQRQLAAEQAAAERLRVTVTPGAKALIVGGVLALLFVVAVL
mgnify:CR=1 FL=1